nr:glycosyltransferase family 4 protein [Lysinibacillus timonensis]
MEIGLLTNIASPYKTLQINEYCNIKNVNITVYYTEPNNKKIKWEEKIARFKEVPLKQINFFSRLNLILNKGIFKILYKSDLIIISGYDQLSMIFMSILCFLFNKPYVVFFDGISKNRLSIRESKFKKLLKKFIVNKSTAVMANGSIGRLYLQNVLSCPKEKIYNQYLSIDYKAINQLAIDKDKYRAYYRNKYNIDDSAKVLLYSGRLIDKKNVEKVIYALSKLKRDDITFLITGGGILEERLRILAEELDINIIITGFIDVQEELFKHYFAADCLILPSIDEPWGLVVNEAMVAGLPVIASDICGCSLDLVKNGVNGFTINPSSVEDIAEKINHVLSKENINMFGEQSKIIISEWTFENSRKNLEAIINDFTLKKEIHKSK